MIILNDYTADPNWWRISICKKQNKTILVCNPVTSAFVDCVPDEAEENHFPPSHLAQFLLCKQQPSLVHTVLCRPRFVPASLSLLYALQLPGCWDCSHVPPHLAYTVCLFGSDLLFRMTPSFSVKVCHSAPECKKM